MQLTKRGDYGVLAVYYLAQRPKGQLVSIDEIAGNCHIPKPYLSKILQDLCRGGLLHSRRGTGGGFMLARAARDISLRDILELIEGKLLLVTCLGEHDHCERANACAIAPFWDELQRVMDEVIGSISIEDLVAPEQRHGRLRELEALRNQYQQRIQP